MQKEFRISETQNFFDASIITGVGLDSIVDFVRLNDLSINEDFSVLHTTVLKFEENIELPVSVDRSTAIASDKFVDFLTIANQTIFDVALMSYGIDGISKLIQSGVIESMDVFINYGAKVRVNENEISDLTFTNFVKKTGIIVKTGEDFRLGMEKASFDLSFDLSFES